ncbi:MAG: sulfotransferase [Desulfobacula sp.]|jgi:hypothetical protein|nr:sulfotransferase [Desulfobacula sp.]
MNDESFVFIVGSPRSGTTVLGTIFDRHKDISQWYEPYFIWDKYFRNAEDDERNKKDATPLVKAYMRKMFGTYRTKRGTQLVVDKSPRNSLKIPFILEIFPNAKFVHILRDGRDTTLSINKEWKKRLAIAGTGGNRASFDYQRSAKVINKWLNRQPYMIDRVKAFWFETHGNVLSKKKHLNRLRWNGDVGWGPRFKNWTDIYNESSMLQFNSHQWVNCVKRINEAWTNIPEKNKIEIRYEDLITQPDKTLEALFTFMQLGYNHTFLSSIPKLKRDNFNKWKKEFASSELSEINPILDPMLSSMGYQI